MSKTIEISRELAERIVKDGVISVAQLDQLRALLAANPEENEPCPQCGGSLRTWGCTCTPRWPMHKPEIAAPAVERQEPVGRVSYIGNGFIRVRCDAPPKLESLVYTSPPAPVAVPDGWKIVPIIATLEMKNAGWRECDRQGVDPESIEMQTIWTAMHLASPDCLDKVKEMNQCS